MSRRPALLCLLGALATTILPAPGEAQIFPSGGSFGIISMGIRGTAAAFDPHNQVYLAVGAYGTVRGRFVRTDGSLVGADFQISTAGLFAHYPRVAFSPHADHGRGAFLVVWHEGSGVFSNFVRARMVSLTSGIIGSELVLGLEPTMWERAPAIDYSPASQNFLVTWQLISNRIRAARVSAAGHLIDGHNLVVSDGFDGDTGERDPSVAYNPYTDHYLIAYSGWGASGAHVTARLVSAANGGMAAPQMLSLAAGTYITDASFSLTTGTYMVVWYQLPGGALGRVVDASGTPVSGIIPVSTRFGSYDGMGFDNNPISGTYLLVGQDQLSFENGAVEVSGGGVPVSAGVMTNVGGAVGNFYPKVAASTTSPQWLLTTAHDFRAVVGQLITSGSNPAPPPAASNPVMSLDVPLNGSTTAGSFSISGWAADFGAPDGTGVSTVHAWAFPANGAPGIFLGAASVGVPRPDVGAVYGARFTPSGFTMTAALHPGSYYIGVYAFSAVTGTFNNSQTALITVLSPPTIPRMALDFPTVNQTVAQNFLVAGWAIDLGAPTGTGIEALHVWAFPAAGGGPLFAGAATPVVWRPDVAAAFGDPRFGMGGFILEIQLPPGEYDLVVYAYSVIARNFNNGVSVRIRVV